MSAEPDATITIAENRLMLGLLGPGDELLRLVERAYPETSILVRGNEIRVFGPRAAEVEQLFGELVELVASGQGMDAQAMSRVIDMVQAKESPSAVGGAPLVRSARGRAVRPKTMGQRRYVDAILGNVVTFGIGPAGTGKSYLAVALALRALQEHEVSRIILTRPAVEAGERLGYLPGDVLAKVDPYLRPLFDALFDMVGPDDAQRLLERGSIEVAPLAFMRGRTLNDSFIILDEAQNTTPEQMKMFLTRIGFGAKAVVTGDDTQVDLLGHRSGLDGVEALLGGIDGVAFVRLGRRDVVRHRIVAEIVAAYERRDAEKPSARVRAGDDRAERRPKR